MEITDLFWTIIYATLDFFTYFYCFKNVLHIPTTSSHMRWFVGLFLIPLWFILYYYTALPYVFLDMTILFLLFKEKWHFKLCCIFAHTLLLNIVSISIFYLLRIITGTVRESLYFHIASIITLLIFYTVIFLFSKKIPADKKPLRDLGWREYCLIAFVAMVDFFLSSVSSLLLVTNINLQGRYSLIFAVYIMVCMSMILLVLYFRLRYYHSALQMKETINQNLLQLEVGHYHDLLQKNRDLRAFRHDYNAHLIAMKGLASTGNLDKLKDYVEQLSELGEKINYIMTNQPVADAVISHFYENLPDDTLFEVNGRFPDRIFLNDTELCIILSNLLRNAVEAVKRQKSTEERRITVSLYADGSYITITVKNTSVPYPEGELSHLPTSKENKTSHGFGLQNVRQVADQYNGRLDLKYRDGIFTASAYLRSPD